MDRKDFLITVGKGVFLACSGSCLLAACSTGDDGGSNVPDTNGGTGGNPVDVTVNLSDLATVGAQKTQNGVLFIRISEGETSASFVATESLCPHQGGRLLFQGSANLIECQLHAARFEVDGGIIRGPQNSSGSVRALKIYTTTINGSSITARKA
ncbi:ubiquinol-cytochrome c reductase iron-sulfur subunit [Leeuwenhoekiella sp. MAR_2009_132]|uniref:QcrA and Rieske domain-containing protein n=1 Tax=Leeuwenhoekiella sp. MAR_2009_132 TaxID=1392489 RepID=UPI00048EC642|nr:Rieske 2Fe-2S domain-containing protein [Leeuwenhoekiella sp. MAR_2009_132]